VRIRLREHSEVTEGATSYETLDRDTFTMPDHIMRCYTTAGLAASVQPTSLLDPACGDAVIPTLIHRLSPMTSMRLCDLSRPALERVRANQLSVLPQDLILDQTDLVTALREDTRQYDLIVLTEILEHLEDPAYVLALARERAKHLIASSPVFFDERQRDPNTEHVWQWDFDGYANLLHEGNWWPQSVSHLRFTHFGYQFQMWLCA
jgi:2-polyprenyl-3-methyl-5-hydroxy-6-metoxy-1,4-benzoquinol methylase